MIPSTLHLISELGDYIIDVRAVFCSVHFPQYSLCLGAHAQARYTIVCLCVRVCICVCRLLQLLKDQ